MDHHDINEIAIANNAIAEAINKAVKKEVNNNIVTRSDALSVSFSDELQLLNSINSITDEIERTVLQGSILTIIKESRKIRDEALLKLIEKSTEQEIESQKIANEIYMKIIDDSIERKKEILTSELKKDTMRTAMFGNRNFLTCLMCFPVIVSVLLVIATHFYVFSSFIIVMWYGMMLDLYFSQSDALDKLLKNFQKRI